MKPTYKNLYYAWLPKRIYSLWQRYHLFWKFLGHAQMATRIENHFLHKGRILYLARADQYTQNVEGKH